MEAARYKTNYSSFTAALSLGVADTLPVQSEL